MDLDGLTRQAAVRAREDVRDGKALGLGTGLTAKHERVLDGLRIVGVPTSETIRSQAESGCIRLPFDEQPDGGHPFVTDGGHWIVDAQCGKSADLAGLAHGLAGIPGVVEHGLFTGLASKVILVTTSGIKVLERPPGR